MMMVIWMGIREMLFDQSRRDDMESLGFVLMYFLRGSLPWQGLKANTKSEKYVQILKCKQATCPDILCCGYPNEFREYFAHCSSLGFEDRPDYCYLKRLFKDLFDRSGFEDDNIFDWDIIRQQEEQRDLEANGAVPDSAAIATDSAGTGAGGVGASVSMATSTGDALGRGRASDMDDQAHPRAEGMSFSMQSSFLL